MSLGIIHTPVIAECLLKCLKRLILIAAFHSAINSKFLLRIYGFYVINFRALLPHMYGDINKLFQCFVELVFFYFLFAHNIYSKLQHCFSIFKPFQSRALQDISQFSQYKPKCLNTAQVACPQHWSRMSGRRAQYVGGLCIYSIKVGLFII